MGTVGPFFLLTEVSTSSKWQTACSYAMMYQSRAFAAAMALHPVAAASAMQLAASANRDLAQLVQQALRWSASAVELPSLLPLGSGMKPTCQPPDMDISEYLWEASEDQSTNSRQVAHNPSSHQTAHPRPRPPPQPPTSLSPLSPRSGRVHGPRSQDSELRNSLYGGRSRDAVANAPPLGDGPQADVMTAGVIAASPAPFHEATTVGTLFAAGTAHGESQVTSVAGDDQAAERSMVCGGEGQGLEKAGCVAPAAPADAVPSSTTMLSPPHSPLVFPHNRLSSASFGLCLGPSEALDSIDPERVSATVEAVSAAAQGPGPEDLKLLHSSFQASVREACEQGVQTRQGQEQGGEEEQGSALREPASTSAISQDGKPQVQGQSVAQKSMLKCTRPSRSRLYGKHVEQGGSTAGRQQARRRAGDLRIQQPEQQPEQQPGELQQDPAQMHVLHQPQRLIAADLGIDTQEGALACRLTPSKSTGQHYQMPAITIHNGDSGHDTLLPPCTSTALYSEHLSGSWVTAEAPGIQIGSKSGPRATYVGQLPSAAATTGTGASSVPPVSNLDGTRLVFHEVAPPGVRATAAHLLSPPGDMAFPPQVQSRTSLARDASCQTLIEGVNLVALGDTAATSPRTIASPTPQPHSLPSVAPAPVSSLFDVLRTLPPDVVWRNLLRGLGPREWCALRQLAREWDLQVRHKWSDSVQLVLGADCVRELRCRVTSGSQRSIGARHSAAKRLYLFHGRIERTIFPNTAIMGSGGLLEMPPVVVDDAPPLSEVLDLTLSSFRTRLQRLHLSAEAAAVSELELDMISVMVPELEELVLRFDCCERPALSLGALTGLSRLQRLGVQLNNSKLNFDPVPECMVGSLTALTGLRALSLDLTATGLPLPAQALEHLTSLRLAVVFRGYSAGQQSEQLRALVSQLGYLTALRALAVPDGYRGSDGDLLRAASFVLPSLTALHMPRLSATRQELEALARLPLLQHVTLGSLDIAPDEDYEDLLPYDSLIQYDGRSGSLWDRPVWRSADPLAPPSHGLSLRPGTSSPHNPWVGSSGGNGGAGVWASSPSTAGSFELSHSAATAGPTSGYGDVELAACTGTGFGGKGTAMGGWGRGSGVLVGMASWRHLVLCGEQRMEALVAAGPLPAGLRELRVEQLRWPRGSRADALTQRGVLALRALCADMARLLAVTVELSLEALSGAATATFHANDGPLPDGRSPAGAAPVVCSSGVGSGNRPFASAGCASVREVVATVCDALGRVRGLRKLRWAGLLPLLAHLGPKSMAQALGRLRQVSDLEVVAGLAGAHPCSSPVFMLYLARGLEAMPCLRRLGLLSSAPHNDALVQGLPGLLAALRRPVLVEASFLSYTDAAALRDLLASRDAPWVAPAGGAATESLPEAETSAGDGSPGEQNVAAPKEGMDAAEGRPRAYNHGVTILAWEEVAAGSSSSSSSSACTVVTGRERQFCAGGWVKGGGLWWVDSRDE